MMKPTDPTGGHGHTRLVCGRCGASVFADTDVDHELTSVSHAGRTTALERAGHEVAMDLCRHCIRDILRQSLGMAPGNGDERRRRAHDDAVARRAMRSIEDTEAFVQASNARLDALRAADERGGGGGGGSQPPPATNSA